MDGWKREWDAEDEWLLLKNQDYTHLTQVSRSEE